ncbi:hypothetical protein BJY52DRAFT_1284870, partial [Lactarius psammicola]
MARDSRSRLPCLAAAFFDLDTVNRERWFFVNGALHTVFFVAFVQMLCYLGVMQWIVKNFACFSFKTM